jgi:hypothetical protein
MSKARSEIMLLCIYMCVCARVQARACVRAPCACVCMCGVIAQVGSRPPVSWGHAFCRTPLNKWSACRRSLYLHKARQTQRDEHKYQSNIKQLYVYPLHHTATRIGYIYIYSFTYMCVEVIHTHTHKYIEAQVWKQRSRSCYVKCYCLLIFHCWVWEIPK